jgi:beta-galactosidase/beta-glucuronidase
MKNINFVLLLTILAFGTTFGQHREYINLAGQWQFELDTANIGIEKNWHLSNLNDSIILPGTTDLNRKGFLNLDTTTMHLNRVYKYEGAAWYKKKVFLPKEFQSKRIILHLERTKQSMIWIDSIFVGKSILLQTPQEFDATNFLSPGEHFITIRIDNSLKLTPYGNVHIYSDDTQTNWNGIIGEIFLEVSEKTYISNLQIYPDIEKKTFDAEIEIENKTGNDNFRIDFFVELTMEGSTKKLKTKSYSVKYEPSLKLNYILGDECYLWDEYGQPIYKLTAVISGSNFKDSKTVEFG